MSEIITQGQILTNYEKALKEHYLPAWRNQLGTEPSVLLGKIKKHKLTSNKIVASAPIGLSGGFGFGAEGEATPAAGGVKIERFVTDAKDMYVNVVISEKAVKLTGTAGAMANALDTEVKGAYETAKWNVGRALFGNGTGKLAAVESTEKKTINDKEVYLIKLNSVANVKEGLIIDVYGNSATLVKAAVRIVAVDRAAKKIAVDQEVSVENGFITVQNSYGKEITGLYAIFDDSIKTIYGVNKEENPFIQPIVLELLENTTIDDGYITKALRQAKNDKNSNIDMILCGDDAYDAYVSYLRTNNYRVEDMSHTINGGFKAIKFVFGNKVIDIVNESFVPADEMWCVETGCLELHSLDWNFAELQGGGIFNLMEGHSAYRALLANYGDLICTNPGGLVRITNVH
jgi:hypothetical protein